MQKNKLFLVILLLSSSSGTVSANSAEQVKADEEYKVYSAVLRAKHQPDATQALIIIKTTSPNQLMLPGSDEEKSILKKLSPLAKETLEDYDVQNAAPVELIDRFNLKAKVLLVDEQDIYDIFRQQGVKGWDSFYKRYPDSDGYIKFSRVGFNPKKDQALLFVAHHCGGRCASGIYYILEKEGGEWHIKKEQMVWVS